MKIVLGIYKNRDDVESAIDMLKDEEYNPKDISIVMKDKKDSKEIGDDTGASVASGAAAGATTGTILGGLAGLLSSIMIPGLGAFFIGGPIAAALGVTGATAAAVSGAATGALAGGLLGALTAWGLSEEEAKAYEESVNEGGILLAVPARSGEEAEVEAVLSDTNAEQIKTITTS